MSLGSADCRFSTRASAEKSDHDVACEDAAEEWRILDELYRSERETLLAFLSRRAKAEDVHDLIHEVFLRAAASSQLTQLVNPGGFLCRIAKNIVIDRARRERARIKAVPMPEGYEPPCPAEQHLHLELQDLLIALDKALGTLPPKTRRIFAMSRTEQRSYREIHQELGISRAAVEYHMMKALAHLRAAVELTG